MAVIIPQFLALPVESGHSEVSSFLILSYLYCKICDLLRTPGILETFLWVLLISNNSKHVNNCRVYFISFID